MNRIRNFLLPVLLIVILCFFEHCHSGQAPAVSKDSPELSRNGNDSLIMQTSMVLTGQKQYDSAVRYLHLMDSLFPGNPAVANAFGNLYAAEKNAVQKTQDPELYYAKALKLDSNFIQAYIDYGSYLSGESKEVEAEKILRMGIGRTQGEGNDRSLLYMNLASNYYQMHNVDAALQYVDSAENGLADPALLHQVKELRDLFFSKR